jgi:hypothetical protein
MVCVCLRLIGSLIDWRARYLYTVNIELDYRKQAFAWRDTCGLANECKYRMVLLVVSFTSGASTGRLT